MHIHTFLFPTPPLFITLLLVYNYNVTLERRAYFTLHFLRVDLVTDNKTTLCELPVEEFISELFSNSPVPGGGATAALVGALGIALGGMVANLTLDKVDYTEVEGDVASLRVSAYRLQKELSDMIEEDAEVFKNLVGAYQMPEDTKEELGSKLRVAEVYLKDSVLLHLEMMQKCGEAIVLLKQFAYKGNRNSIADAGCGAIMCKAAMQSAWLNVCANIKLIYDTHFVGEINSEARELLKKHLPIADEIYKLAGQRVLQK